MIKNEFSFDKTVPEVSIQSPQPLTRGKDLGPVVQGIVSLTTSLRRHFV